MKTQRLLSALALIALLPPGAHGADLRKIERKIAKEPTYRGQPKYCLLVFGPEAKTRVWLVQDAGTLYVDRNGNGDLTEEGKKVVGEKWEGAEAGEYSFHAGDIRDGSLLHKALEVSVVKLGDRVVADVDENAKDLVAKDPKARGYGVSIDIEIPGWKGAGLGGRVQQHPSLTDINGVLQFADRVEEAPIIHFGGPLQVTLFDRHKLTVGRKTDLVLGVGTPGVGPGTTAYINYERVIPTNVYPIAEIVYPPSLPGEPPIRERYVLKERC
jgi:hypothetical protein